MTDAERARIIAETRATLERLRDFPNEPVNDKQPTPVQPLPVFEDPVEKWKREADENTRRREAAIAERRRQEREMVRADWSAMNAWCDQRIAAALAEHHQQFSELARAIIAFADAVDKKLCELQALVTKLGTVHEQLRTHDARQPLDLPNPLIRKERLVN